MIAFNGVAQSVYTTNQGHSHNDYRQARPFFAAYEAGIGSIEADVFLRGGDLLVAHEESEIDPARSLDLLYLKPIAEQFRQNDGRPYADTGWKLQLVIDIKESYEDLIPVLIRQLSTYRGVFDPRRNPHAVKVVLSGNTPPPSAFSDYPDFIYFDGRPGIVYTPAQAQRLGMISANLKDHSRWGGMGAPAVNDWQKLRAIIQEAEALQVPFRFWGTDDSPNAWLELEKMGAGWIGTDQPGQLRAFYDKRATTQYVRLQPYDVYRPTYKSDGRNKKAKNIILLIGDGMGLAQIQAGLTTNHGQLHMAMFRFIGLSRTESTNSDITDSAAGATAIASGEKTNNRYIGMDSSGRPLATLPDKLSVKGIRSGVISTSDITDATPAAFYAHRPERDMTHEIAGDFLNSNVDILVGPNRKSFIDNPDSELMSKLEQKGFRYSATLDEFKASAAEKNIVLLHDSVCKAAKNGRGDMLQTSLQETIRKLSSGKKGFFIMAEGGRIDDGGHYNDLPYVAAELHDFDRAIGEALRFADQDGQTLVVVTADHETGGLSLIDANYRKGVIRGHFSTQDHTNIMVPVFAYGPGAGTFTGVYSNTDIHYKILRAAGLAD